MPDVIDEYSDMADKILQTGLYVRVSTKEQTTANQRLELERVAQARGWEVVGIYEDTGISGNKGRDQRPGFNRLCNDAVSGKINHIAAWSIDRIGRSLSHLVEFIDDLSAQRVGLYLHQQQVDTSTAAGRAFVQMAGVFASFERSLIIERINAGLSRARAQGKRLGRPPVAVKVENRIRKLRAKGYGKLRIARELHVGVGTVLRVVGAERAQQAA